jgi:hypothetical protein
MGWCAGCLGVYHVDSLTWWGPLQWGDLVSSIIVDWFLAPRRRGFYLKPRSTNYPDHGHYGDPPPTRKIPMVEPGIEPWTSWLVVRSSDHQTTRLVLLLFEILYINLLELERVVVDILYGFEMLFTLKSIPRKCQWKILLKSQNQPSLNYWFSKINSLDL